MNRLLVCWSTVGLCLAVAFTNAGCNQRKCGADTVPFGDKCRAVPHDGGTQMEGGMADSGASSEMPEAGESGSGASDASYQDARGAEQTSDSGPKAEPESCNFRDDDLDGLVDEGFAIAKLNAEAEQVFTQTSITAPLSGQVALLERSEGGLWLLYREWENFNDDPARQIRAVRLDESGRYVSQAGDPKLIGSGATNWVAAGDGVFTVVLERLRNSSTNVTTLRLGLYRTSDLSQIDQIVLAENGSGLDAQPMNLAVYADAEGTVHIAAGVAVQQSAGDNETWNVRLRLVKRTAAGTMTIVAEPVLYSGKKPFFQFGPQMLQVAPVPCRSEWLLAYNTESSSNLRRLSAAGEFLETSLAAPPAGAVWVGMNAGEAQCERQDPSMILAFYSSAGTRLRILSVDRKTGAMSQVGSELEVLNAVALHGRQLGNRWFLTASLDSAQAYELDLSKAGPLTPLSLYTDKAGANPGILKGDLGEALFLPGMGAIAFAGATLVVAYPRGDGSINNLSSFINTAPFDQTATPAAVTYRLGCN